MDLPPGHPLEGPPDWFDPTGLHKRRQREEMQKVNPLGCGILCIPFVFPILIPLCLPLYPIAAAGFGVAYLIAVQFFPSTRIPAGGYNWYALAPSLIVFWVLMRLENRLGEIRAYLILRHLFRLIALAGVIIYVTTFDAPRPDDLFSRLGTFFSSFTTIGVSAAILAFFHYILWGEGAIRTFWHGTMQFLRMRPADVGD